MKGYEVGTSHGAGKSVGLGQLLAMVFKRPVAMLIAWWWSQAAKHYAISAAAETRKQREAAANVAYYDKMTSIALANSRRK
jgi:hypothetical protein